MSLEEILLIHSITIYLSISIAFYLIKRIESKILALIAQPSSARQRSQLMKKRELLKKGALKHAIFWPFYMFRHDKKTKK